MTEDLDFDSEFSKQIVRSYAASLFEKLHTYFEILGRNPEATFNRRQCANMSLILLNFVVNLPFEIPEFKLLLIESLPELKESYALYPIELKELTDKVITQIEEFIKN